jgi:sigma-B regulation protein RsbU (phosphoserine phosphatase)
MTVSMRAGDCLLFYTDGVNEAVNERGTEEFGIERLIKEFQNSAPGGAENVLTSLENALRLFVGSQVQTDDITLIAIEKR